MIANAGAGAAVGAFILVVIIVGAYFLPTIIALARKVSNTGSVAVINFLLGWTLVGWAVALAMAVKTKNQPGTIVVQQLMMRCRKCARPVESNARFCPSCGTSRD